MLQLQQPSQKWWSALGNNSLRLDHRIFSPFHPKARPWLCFPVRHATHGAQGRANGPKNGPGPRLGAKKTGDEYVVPGNIIFRQRGTHWFAGENAGMGRDHTIFAQQAGYVRYYRNPQLHTERRYIGVVFDKTQTLPTPANAARRRRLNMTTVPRNTIFAPSSEPLNLSNSTMNRSCSDTDISVKQPRQTRREKREAGVKRSTGRVPANELQLRPGYSYRESNYAIGMAAERAGVEAVAYKKGDRFLAWRKKAQRVNRNAEKRSLSRKPSKSK